MPRSGRPPYLITEFLAVGPCRGAGGPSVDSLARAGFTHIIDLNADHSERSLSKRAGISYFPIRTVDEDSVRTWVKKLGRGVKVIEEASRNNGKVYLHCTYGRGRSPTMAMAFLVWKGWPVQGAISHVTRGASKVWDRGNPVTKYQKILEAYAGISGRSRARPAG